MSSALNLLKSVGKKPYKGFSQLAVGNHHIHLFRLVPNRMYNSKDKTSLKKVLLVELESEVLFLPEYFTAAIGEDERKVEELNSDGVRKYLYFGGARPNK